MKISSKKVFLSFFLLIKFYQREGGGDISTRRKAIMFVKCRENAMKDHAIKTKLNHYIKYVKNYMYSPFFRMQYF